jgi:hypothetical protein
VSAVVFDKVGMEKQEEKSRDRKAEIGKQEKGNAEIRKKVEIGKYK